MLLKKRKKSIARSGKWTQIHWSYRRTITILIQQSRLPFKQLMHVLTTQF